MPDDVKKPPDSGSVFDDWDEDEPQGDQMTDIAGMLDSDEVEIELVEDNGLPLPSVGETEWTEREPTPGRAAVEDLRNELSQVKEMYLRKLAEFDNFRKRTEREREELRAIANENLVRDLVPVLDNFDRALHHAGQADTETLRVGVEMIYRQFRELLQRRGVAEVDPAGRSFNPELHEAVQRVENTSHPTGHVVDVVAKGYMLSGRLIRPALVAVAVEAPDNRTQGTVQDGAEGETVP